jgi:hypothetical protein
MDEQLDNGLCSRKDGPPPSDALKAFSLLFALKETKTFFFLVSFAARGMLASLRQR